MASANDNVNQARAWLGKNRLTASGYDYYTIQSIVNNLS